MQFAGLLLKRIGIAFFIKANKSSFELLQSQKKVVIRAALRGKIVLPGFC